MIFTSSNVLIRALQKFYNKYKVLGMKAEALEAHSKLLEIESRLTKFAYLSKEPLPGVADALIFQKLKNSQSKAWFTQKSRPRTATSTSTTGTSPCRSSRRRKSRSGPRIRMPWNRTSWSSTVSPSSTASSPPLPSSELIPSSTTSWTSSWRSRWRATRRWWRTSWRC